MAVKIACSASPVLVPKPGSGWADTMVLNPGMIKDPDSSRLHMLFRATGPWPQARIEGSIAAIRSGRFPPTPLGVTCAYCDARRACRYEAWRIARKEPQA